MRKVLSVVLALCMVASLLVLASCAKPTTTQTNGLTSLKYVGDRKFKKSFDSIITLQEILDDVSVVDIKMEMNVSGLDKQTEVNEEDSTSIDYYYRNKTPIYAVYNGYGENVWKYFTTSKSGIPIVVSLWDEGNGRNVSIEYNGDALDVAYEYWVSYQNVSTDFGNGAKQIDVGVSKGDESYAYTIIDNCYFISSATYWDSKDGDLHRYQAQLDEDSNKIDYSYDEVVISGKLPELSQDEINVKSTGISSINLEEVDILLGRHKVYKTQDGKMSISAETTLVFKDKASADRALERLKSASVKAKDFTVDDNSENEAFTINIGTCYFEMSPDFEEANSVLTEYAMEVFDDYRFIVVDLDKDGNITSFENSTISYY